MGVFSKTLLQLTKQPLHSTGYLGPSIYLPWCLYQLAVNPLMVTVGLRLDSGKEQIQISEKLLLFTVAAATVTALAGFALAVFLMNRKYRRTFLGRFSFREYVKKLWESRTYAPIGKGLDASRASLLYFFR